MVKPKQMGKKTRMNFSKIEEVLEMPDLIEIQKKSYKWFIDKGLMEALSDISPISNYSGTLLIDFVSYHLDSQPKMSVEECKDHDANYAAPLKVDVRLTNKTTGEVKQSEIFMGDFPIMTEKGTFVINGAERVIISQLVRSPGMYYDYSIDKTGKHIYTAQVIPYRGAWLEYETDVNDVFYVKIDKSRKLPITVLIRALGIESSADMISYFGEEKLITESCSKDGLHDMAVENNSSETEEALKEIYRRLRPG
ncbi:MAG: DNA-directed RNA polymerase subunit beta, partial [Firmicutes bacterium]|nr:DNA-directed RNA polymerase subunit beta [Bacillota bacterium]